MPALESVVFVRCVFECVQHLEVNAVFDGETRAWV
jgi:hypothetical protein